MDTFKLIVDHIAEIEKEIRIQTNGTVRATLLLAKSEALKALVMYRK